MKLNLIIGKSNLPSGVYFYRLQAGRFCSDEENDSFKVRRGKLEERSKGELRLAQIKKYKECPVILITITTEYSDNQSLIY